MTKNEAEKILTEHGQEHLLSFWDTLSEDSRKSLLEQIEALDFDLIDALREKLSNIRANVPALSDMTPAPVTLLCGKAKDAAYRDGETELRNGRVAALLVAGGQGTRLGYDGPKGCYPIGPLSGESLFYFHVRKLLAIQRRWGAPVPLYIMTSRTNDAVTREFFEKNSYFGLNPKDVFFFVQSMWPAFDASGKIILDAPDHIFLSPDGHGGTLSALKSSGALDDMISRGIKSVFYFQVDNPLVDVCDPAFIGCHVKNQADASVKVCAKRDPDEGLGVVVVSSGKSKIVEYTELTPERRNERSSNGELLFSYGSVAIHVFSVSFLKKEADAGLPVHAAHKKVPFTDMEGRVVKPDAPNAFKFEKFIFDVLPDAEKTINLVFDRSLEFSPVKNACGSDSPDTCRADLSRKWAHWFEDSGIVIPFDRSGYPLHRIEIDPCFADSAAVLRAAIESGSVHAKPQEDMILRCDN